jgi:hypothetical protein
MTKQSHKNHSCFQLYINFKDYLIDWFFSSKLATFHTDTGARALTAPRKVEVEHLTRVHPRFGWGSGIGRAGGRSSAPIILDNRTTAFLLMEAPMGKCAGLRAVRDQRGQSRDAQLNN